MPGRDMYVGARYLLATVAVAHVCWPRRFAAAEHARGTRERSLHFVTPAHVVSFVQDYLFTAESLEAHDQYQLVHVLPGKILDSELAAQRDPNHSTIKR